MNSTNVAISLIGLLFCLSCKTAQQDPEPAEMFNYKSVQVNGKTSSGLSFKDVSLTPTIRVAFSVPVNEQSAKTNIQLTEKATANPVSLSYAFGNTDTTVTVTPQSPLKPLTAYTVTVLPTLTSQRSTTFTSNLTVSLTTALDSTDKFSRISDDALLDLVQKQTFKYFWDFGHPTSGMARERNSSGDVVTSGGTGFGIMAVLVAVNRNFITRQDGLTRLNKIANFLTNNAKRYHGAFPHWLNGATGATIPFSQKDDGADLVRNVVPDAGLINRPAILQQHHRRRRNRTSENDQCPLGRRGNGTGLPKAVPKRICTGTGPRTTTGI